MMRATASGLAACLALLAGCVSPPPPSAPDWQAQRQQLTALEHWQASGKIALRTAQQAESADLLWRQDGAATHLELSGPLGFAATTVDSNGSYLSVRRGDDYQRWDLDDPTLAAANQWDLPLSALQYWLRGIPAPGAAPDALELDPHSRVPLSMQQWGWTVVYTRFELFGAYLLPTRLEVDKGETRARILLRDWQVGSP